jgi:hypothetical protein
MRCPFCDVDGPRRQIHRHLVDQHGSVVETAADEQEGKMSYFIACPRCGGQIRHQVKPRWSDPSFLKEFEPEIRLVAFDLLLYHLEDAHPEAPADGASTN